MFQITPKKKSFWKTSFLSVLVFSLLLVEFFPSSSFALGETTHIWDFDLENASNYTYDSELVTVDDTGARPTANLFENPSFLENNTSWSVEALPPAGWVEVPGNDALYDTDNFLVMKYEAKCADSSAPTVGFTSPTIGYGDYNDSGTGGVACTAANSKAVVSIPSGYPIASITQTAFLDRCASVTLGTTSSHLITNDEWMTIARNIEVQDENWTLGTVGSGYLFAGHNDGAPGKALPASSQDTGNYTCAYTDGANPNEENPSGACPTNTASATSGTAGLQKRTHTLSNEEVIWDLAGNMYEWTSTNLTCAGTNCTVNEMPYGVSSGSEWLEYSSGATGWVGDVLTTYGAYTWDDLGPSDHTYNSDEGIGRLYSDANAASPSGNTHAFLRGGHWSSYTSSGVFTLRLNAAPSISNNFFGSRCASDPVAILSSFSSGSGREAAGGNRVASGDVTDARFYQALSLGDSDIYSFSAYVYNDTSGEEGDPVDSDIAELYYGGEEITDLEYTEVTGETGWYRLSGQITGSAASLKTGISVKSGKTVIVDDFTLAKSGEYSVYTSEAYSNSKLMSWDSFAESADYSGNASISYQLCSDDGDTCESDGTWMYYNGSAWTSATNTTSDVNTAAELTSGVMNAFPIETKKLSVKTIFSFEGADTPLLNSLTLGMTTDETPPTGTISINGGDSSTSNPVVSLTLSATDTLSGVVEMMLSNNSNFQGASWENYAETSEWTVPSGDGEKTVYVKYRDNAGNISSSVSDTILLDSGIPTGTISINNGDEYTNTEEVTLTITGTDELGEISEMMISEDLDFTGASWEDYAETKDYTLSSPDGVKNVYIKYKDEGGNESLTYSDSITLDTSAELEIIEIDNEDYDPETDTYETDDITPTIEGEGEVGGEVTIEVLGTDNTVISTTTLEIDENGEWSWTSGEELIQGQSYTIRVTVTDLAGNTDETEFTLRILGADDEDPIDDDDDEPTDDDDDDEEPEDDDEDDDVIDVDQVDDEEETGELPNTNLLLTISFFLGFGLLLIAMNLKTIKRLGKRLR